MLPFYYWKMPASLFIAFTWSVSTRLWATQMLYFDERSQDVNPKKRNPTANLGHENDKSYKAFIDDRRYCSSHKTLIFQRLRDKLKGLHQDLTCLKLNDPFIRVYHGALWLWQIWKFGFFYPESLSHEFSFWVFAGLHCSSLLKTELIRRKHANFLWLKWNPR